MELHNEEDKLTQNDIQKKQRKNREKTNSLELVVKQQNIKISHLLEQVENLKTNNVYMTTLLEELLYVMSSSKEEKEFKIKNANLDLIENLVKFN